MFLWKLKQNCAWTAGSCHGPIGQAHVNINQDQMLSHTVFLVHAAWQPCKQQVGITQMALHSTAQKICWLLAWL